MEAKKINLIAGSYTPQQAKEMLTKMIKEEQQFHQLQNFTSLIRYEGNCEQATENIHRLCRAQKEIDSLLALAKAENLHLKVETSLRLSLVEEHVHAKAEAACPSL
jgi:hypothetical protein